MWNRLIYLLLVFLIKLNVTNAQNCNINLSGYIYDAGTLEPLEYANILVEEDLLGSVTDSLGFFVIKNLCEGHIHVSFSHIGCESQRLHLDVIRDTSIVFYLNHTDHVLHEINIIGDNFPKTTQNLESLNKQIISDNAPDNLSNLISSITGVSTLKNGSSISKPIVNGLYGNRLTILNNGLIQAGQQWGNDHSPEIDPLVANKISIIKGVNAITYLNGQLGAIVLVEPGSIERDPHTHGSAQYFYESNGRSHGMNVQLQKYNSKFAWKLNATVKKGGDKSSAQYLLNNTGVQEVNIALQIEKEISKKLSNRLYLSTFNTELGVLRGSLISNITDLEEAIGRDIPFFTEDNFSYVIDPPQQKVSHHLIKNNTKYFIDDNKWFDISISGQYNLRQEFDLRRGGRSETPVLNLAQLMTIIDINYTHEINNEIVFKSGLQGYTIDNNNNPETGILPLIPNYFAHNSGAYTTLSKTTDKYQFEAGIRYDLTGFDVVTFSNSIPREILRFSDIYHNFSSSLGLKYSFDNNCNVSVNTAFAMRNPAINERFSLGLHQGVSGIEEGDPNITSETSWKSTLSFNNSPKKALYFESLVYYHNIGNYIFLKAQDEIRLTIRGAFPLFTYNQTNASIIGLDTYLRYNVNKNLTSTLSYSYIQGTNNSNDTGLAFIPANNLSAKLTYALVKPVILFGKSLENLEINIEDRYVFKKTGVDDVFDFLPPPDAYNLLSIGLSGDIQLKSIRVRLSLKANNILNAEYRDYLNRQRYFADDIGRNIRAGIRVRF